MFKLFKKAVVVFSVLLSVNAIAAPGNIIQVAQKAGDFKTLLTAVKVAGLTKTLESKGPFTVFAPTDEAFAALPKQALDGLLQNPKKLAQVLLYHVVSGRVMSTDLQDESVKTLNGADVTIKLTNSAVMVNDATVVKADVKASNGVIHVIDKVLLPPVSN